MALFDLLGRRWSMGVIWNLCDAGPLTFRALEAKCETITPASLNTRLKELMAAGLVNKVDGGYAATDLGVQLYRHLQPMADFSLQWAEFLAEHD